MHSVALCRGILLFLINFLVFDASKTKSFADLSRFYSFKFSDFFILLRRRLTFALSYQWVVYTKDELVCIG